MDDNAFVLVRTVVVRLLLVSLVVRLVVSFFFPTDGFALGMSYVGTAVSAMVEDGDSYTEARRKVLGIRDMHGVSNKPWQGKVKGPESRPDYDSPALQPKPKGTVAKHQQNEGSNQWWNDECHDYGHSSTYGAPRSRGSTQKGKPGKPY